MPKNAGSLKKNVRAIFEKKQPSKNALFVGRFDAFLYTASPKA